MLIQKVFLPPLHIELGLMYQFSKALNKTGDCLQYLNEVFPHLSEGKMKEGIDIRWLMKDEKFEEKKWNQVEKDAWVSFKDVTQKFLGNYKDPNYTTIVEKNALKLSKTRL